MALGMLGLISLKAKIEQTKLQFFGSLCRLRSSAAVKQLFLLRLYQKHLGVYKSTKGVINDIWFIIFKYGLEEDLNMFLEDGFFPSKQSWKLFVKNAIYWKEQSEWHVRLSNCDDFSRFKCLHGSLRPSSLWFLWKHLSSFQSNICSRVANLWLLSPRCELLCAKCNVISHDALAHCLLDCKHQDLFDLRDEFFTNIVNNFPVEIYVKLDNLDRHELICVLLGYIPDYIQELLPDDGYCIRFAYVCCCFSVKAAEFAFQ